MEALDSGVRRNDELKSTAALPFFGALAAMAS